MSILTMMTVDAEEQWDWGGPFPTGDFTVTNIARLPRFQEICEKQGIATTYFVNQAVLDDPDARAVVLELAGRDRVEIGMHIHPWNTPPLEDGAPVTPRDTFLHNLPAELAEAKLETCYGRFRDCGLRPTSFRGGRYSRGEAVHRFLRQKGFLADTSVCPFTTWQDDGAPDYRGRGIEPVRFPPGDGGELPLWEIPLTLGFTRRPFALWERIYEAIERSWLSKLRLIGIAEKLGIVRKVWLNFEYQDGPDMVLFLRKLRRMQVPCVCLTVHSSSLVAGLNPYTPTPEAEARLFAKLDLVFGELASCDEFEPVTVSQAAQRLEEAYHARAGN